MATDANYSENEHDLRIPNSHFHSSPIYAHRLDLKVDTNSRLHGLEHSISKTKQDTGLSDATIADKKDLKGLVKLHPRDGKTAKLDEEF